MKNFRHVVGRGMFIIGWITLACIIAFVFFSIGRVGASVGTFQIPGLEREEHLEVHREKVEKVRVSYALGEKRLLIALDKQIGELQGAEACPSAWLALIENDRDMYETAVYAHASRNKVSFFLDVTPAPDDLCVIYDLWAVDDK